MIFGITVINIVGIRFASVINNVGVLAELFGLSTVLVLLLFHGLQQPLSFLTQTGGTDANGLIVPLLTVFLMPVVHHRQLRLDGPRRRGDQGRRARRRRAAC